LTKEKQIYEDYKENLLKELDKVKDSFSDYVFLCIGTSKVIGDSFGPFVGYFLLQKMQHKKYMHVIGNIDTNVSYLNAKHNIEQIYKRFKKPCIIAIDSAFSKKKDIGKIFVANNHIKLGEGLGKEEYKVGNISIKGVVAQNSRLPYYNFLKLKTISKEFIIDLAKNTAKGICEVNYCIK